MDLLAQSAVAAASASAPASSPPESSVTSPSASSATHAGTAAAREAKRIAKRNLPNDMAHPQYYSRRSDYKVLPIDVTFSEPYDYNRPHSPSNRHEEFNWCAAHRKRVLEYEEKKEKGGYNSSYVEALRNPHTYLTTAAVTDNGRPVFNDEIDRDSIDSNSDEDEDQNDEDEDEEEWWEEQDGVDHDSAPDSDEDEEDDAQGAIVADYHDIEVEIMPRLKRVTKLPDEMCEIVCSYLDPDADFGLLLDDIALLVVRTFDTIEEYREQSKKYFNEFLPSPSEEALQEEMPESTIGILKKNKEHKQKYEAMQQKVEDKKENHEMTAAAAAAAVAASFSSSSSSKKVNDKAETRGSFYSYPVRLYLCSDSRQYLRELESILKIELVPRLFQPVVDAVRECIENGTSETLSRQRLLLMRDWFQRDFDGWEECLTQLEHRIAVVEEEWQFASDVLMVCGYLLDDRPSSGFFRRNRSSYRVRYTIDSTSNRPSESMYVRTLNDRNRTVGFHKKWLLKDFKLMIEELTHIPVAEQRLEIRKNEEEEEEQEGGAKRSPSQPAPPIVYPLTRDEETLESHFPPNSTSWTWAIDGHHIFLNNKIQRWFFNRSYWINLTPHVEWLRRPSTEEEEDEEPLYDDPEENRMHGWIINPIESEEQESSELLGSSLSDAHQALLDEFSRLELLHPAAPIEKEKPSLWSQLQVQEEQKQTAPSSSSSPPVPLAQQSHVAVMSRVSYVLEQRLHDSEWMDYDDPALAHQDHSNQNTNHRDKDLKRVDPEINQADATLARVWKWIHAIQSWSSEKDEEIILERPIFATIAPLIRDLKSAIASPCYVYDANPTPSKLTSKVTNNKENENVAAATALPSSSSSSASSSSSMMEIDDYVSSSSTTIGTTVTVDSTLEQPTKKMKLDHDAPVSCKNIGAASTFSTLSPLTSASPSSSSSSSLSSSPSLPLYTGELCIFRRLMTPEKHAAAQKLIELMIHVHALKPWLGMSDDAAYLTELIKVTESLRHTMAQYYLHHMTRSESLDREIREWNARLASAAEVRNEVSHDAVFDRHTFSLLVSEVSQDFMNDLNFTPAALQILQEAAETKIVKHFALATQMRGCQRAAQLPAGNTDLCRDEPFLNSTPLSAIESQHATSMNRAVHAEYAPSNR